MKNLGKFYKTMFIVAKLVVACVLVTPTMVLLCMGNPYLAGLGLLWALAQWGLYITYPRVQRFWNDVRDILNS